MKLDWKLIAVPVVIVLLAIWALNRFAPKVGIMIFSQGAGTTPTVTPSATPTSPATP